jgi:2',3'-cyclic-nucleotide 2'-phosphodiesterase (5'-nucleotidase family)
LQKFIILHSNDIHGQIEALARITTLVKQIRAENPDLPVLYLDAGDIEETSTRVSNLTRGAGMHRLLSTAGCQAETVGNGGILRYGFEVLTNYSAAARYPLLLANVRELDGSLPPGVQATTMLLAGEIRLGLIGITDNIGHTYDEFFSMLVLPEFPLVRELAAQLRKEGADAVILLSHMGLKQDRELAAQEEVSLIIGAHSHHFLPEGEWVGDILITQMGQFGTHLGRLDLLWDGARLIVERASALPVSEAIVPDPTIADEVEAIEADMAHFLNVIVGELAELLDFATDRECKVANLMADALRERMQADIGIVVAANASTRSLPAGPLRREIWWEACYAGSNPGIVEMTGEQLQIVITRGQDRALAAKSAMALRCKERGLLHLSRASIRDGQIFVGEQPIELERIYSVAGSDWELEPYGGYVEAAWELPIRYDLPTTICDVLEAYLAEHGPICVDLGRLG